MADVAGDRVAQPSAAPTGVDVTHPRVHVDLDQAGERPAGDCRLGIGGLGPRLQGELFGSHAGEAVLDLQPVRVQRRRLLDHRRERRGDVGGKLIVEQLEFVHVGLERPDEGIGDRHPGLPVAQRGRQSLDELVGVVEHHRFLGREVVVERLQRDVDAVGDLRHLHCVEAATGEHRGCGVGDEMAGEPALALAQPFAGMLGAVALLLGVPHAAQAVDDLLAHLLGDDTVKDAPVGLLGTGSAGAWLAHTSTIHQKFTLIYFYVLTIFIICVFL